MCGCTVLISIQFLAFLETTIDNYPLKIDKKK